MLIDAGFSSRNPDSVVAGHQPINHSNMYYDWKKWARTTSGDGRLPLFTAAARSLKWSHTSQIFNANMPVVHEKDILTGLPPFMLAAAGTASDIESVYKLLREYPPAIFITDA